MATVFVEGLEFYAYHGVSPEERTVGHRYRLDLSMEVDARATVTDDIEDTVNYADAAGRLCALGETTTCHTLERLAELMLSDLMERYPLVTAARIRLAKRMPPAPFIAETVGVELSRFRQ
jgi:dihydroneopterin aldolase